jgi:hypothetical protein
MIENNKDPNLRVKGHDSFDEGIFELFYVQLNCNITNITKALAPLIAKCRSASLAAVLAFLCLCSSNWLGVCEEPVV